MSHGYPALPLPPGCPWSDFQPPLVKYCEENLCSWITAPANTWSNLSYIAVGIWLWRELHKKQSGLVELFVPAALITGVGSFLYHASYTFTFQVLDFLGMFMFSGLILTLNLRRMGWVSKRSALVTYVFFVLLGTGLTYFSKGSLARNAFAFQVIATLVLECVLYRRTLSSSQKIDYKWFARSLATFGVAYTAWWIDTGNIWCDPTNHLIQGHAVWHGVNAFCFWTMAQYFRQFKETTG